MKTVYILSAVRTPLGSFGGMFSELSAIKLGSVAIKGAIEKSGVDPNKVNEVYFGNVVSANLGQAPARQAAKGAGLPDSVQCTTVNKVCASGMKSVMFGAQSIMLGFADVVVAGGMESMTNIPYYIPKARFGYKYGNAELIDGLHNDGLMDAYDRGAMGVYADATAAKYGITREQQDAYAIESYTRVGKATDAGKFNNEIVAVGIPQRKGDPLMVSMDEEYKKVDFAKVPGLRPAFTKDGTVTAANSSTINDGAAALVLASEEFVKANNLTPVARIVSFADAEQDPQWFTTTPTIAAPIAMQRAGLKVSDISNFEVNEAFAVVTMAFNKLLDIDPAQCNVYGGAVALGHPLGASGARIITTLNSVLHQENGRYGLAAICNGGGGASSIIIEKM
ncbi:MAG: acetyl-CoA C-acyltransferase [Saprospiraceae bacterium]|jgi:acetyl-CoA C-acetyltransferase|nr:acetyl-CoA C-acyltransferase [Saprospiraceae bacterium]